MHAMRKPIALVALAALGLCLAGAANAGPGP